MSKKSAPIPPQTIGSITGVLLAVGIFAVSAVGVLILSNALTPLLRLWGLF